MDGADKGNDLFPRYQHLRHLQHLLHSPSLPSRSLIHCLAQSIQIYNLHSSENVLPHRHPPASPPPALHPPPPRNSASAVAATAATAVMAATHATTSKPACAHRIHNRNLRPRHAVPARPGTLARSPAGPPFFSALAEEMGGAAQVAVQGVNDYAADVSPLPPYTHIHTRTDVEVGILQGFPRRAGAEAAGCV